MNSGDPEQAQLAQLELVVQSGGDDASVRVVLVGELDVATASQLRTQLDEAIGRGHGEVHVDLAGLQFCGAAGVSELLRARRSLAALGRRLVLTAVPDQIARTIRLAAATELLDS